MPLPDSAAQPTPRVFGAGGKRMHFMFVAALVWLVVKQLWLMRLIGMAPTYTLQLGTLGATLVLASPALWLRGRAQAVWLLAADALTSLITYANVVYYRQYADLVSVASVKFAGQLGEVHGSVAALLHPGDLLVALDLLLFAGLLCVRRIPWQPLFRRGPGWLALAGVLAGGAVASVITLKDPFLTETYAGHTGLAAHVGVLNYQVVDAVRYTGRMLRRSTPPPSVEAEVENWFEENPPAPTATSDLHGIAKGDNVIYLQVESLHNFAVGMKVDGQEITPNLNKLAGESIRFRNFYTQIGQGTTADAEFLANCSLYPAPTGAVYVDYASNNFDCMPALLKNAGYYTAVMHADRPDFWNRATVYPKIGFDRFFNAADYVQDGKIGLGLADASFLRQSVDKLQTLPQPFQAIVITLSSHAPYTGKDIPPTLDLGTLNGTTAGNYLQAIHYVDACIGDFVNGLKRSGLLDHTVLVVYGDHTILKRNADGLADLLKLTPDRQTAWAKVENKVPFLIRLPNRQGEVRTQNAGEIDIAPTLAGLLDIPTNHTMFMGRDLFAEPQGVTVLHNGSAISGDHMFLTDTGGGVSGCFVPSNGHPLPASACALESQRAHENLNVASQILNFNLMPKGG